MEKSFGCKALVLNKDIVLLQLCCASTYGFMAITVLFWLLGGFSCFGHAIQKAYHLSTRSGVLVLEGPSLGGHF